MSGRAPNRNQPPLPNRDATKQQKETQEVNELCLIYTELQRDIVENVYRVTDCNFDKSLAALESMQKSLEQEKTKAALTPQVKLAFFSLMFDKLNKEYISFVLNSHAWSVEASLDELLKKEEERAQLEELERKRKEMERLRAEQEERERLRIQKEEIERRDKILQLQAQFPCINPNFIGQTLQTQNWDFAAAHRIVYETERQRLQQLEMEKARLLEEARIQEERRAFEHQQKLKLEAEAMKKEQLEQVVQGVSSWDQVYNNFLNRVGKSNEENRDTMNDRRAMEEVALQVVPFVSQEEISETFAQNNWDLEFSIPALEVVSRRNFKKKIEAVYPHLPEQDVDFIATQEFPDESQAIEKLRSVATHRKIVAHLENLSNFALNNLNDAEKRKAAFEYEAEQIRERQRIRAKEIEGFPPDQKATMLNVDAMKRQQEDYYITENLQRYAKEVADCKKAYDDAQNTLATEHTRAPKWTSATPKNRNLALSKENFNKCLAEKRNTIRQDAEKVRRSVIEEKLVKELGQHRFEKLQQAIGYAPGGFAPRVGPPAPNTTEATVPNSVVPPPMPANTEQSTTNTNTTQQPAQSYRPYMTQNDAQTNQPQTQTVPQTTQPYGQTSPAQPVQPVQPVQPSNQQTQYNPQASTLQYSPQSTQPTQLTQPYNQQPTQSTQQYSPQPTQPTLPMNQQPLPLNQTTQPQPFNQTTQPPQPTQPYQPPQPYNQTAQPQQPTQPYQPPQQYNQTTQPPQPTQPYQPPQPYNQTTQPPQTFNQTTQPYNQKPVQPYNPQTTQPYNPQATQPYNPQTTQPYKPQTTQPYNPQTTQPYPPSAQQTQPYNTSPYNPQISPQHPSVPSYQPSTIPTQSTPTQHPPVPVTQDEYDMYQYYFKIGAAGKTHLMAEDASFLTTSRLSQEVLADVWHLASLGDNKLNFNQFVIAARLISLAQAGYPTDLTYISYSLPHPKFYGYTYPPMTTQLQNTYPYQQTNPQNNQPQPHTHTQPYQYGRYN